MKIKPGYMKVLMVEAILIAVFILHIVFGFFTANTLLVFLAVTTTILFYFLGYEKDRSRYKKDIILTTVIFSITYLIITNLIGFALGFVRTAYSLTPSDIIRRVVVAIFIITLTEIMRYIIVTKGSRYRSLCILSIFLFVIVDIALKLTIFNLADIEGLIMFTGLILLPSITKNIMLTYVSLRVGYKPGLIYRFFFELPILFLPIFTNFGIYMLAIIEIITPTIFMYIVSRSLIKVDPKTFKRKRKGVTIVGTIVVVLMIVMITLASGFFRYFTITIGSRKYVRNN